VVDVLKQPCASLDIRKHHRGSGQRALLAEALASMGG